MTGYLKARAVAMPLPPAGADEARAEPPSSPARDAHLQLCEIDAMLERIAAGRNRPAGAPAEAPLVATFLRAMLLSWAGRPEAAVPLLLAVREGCGAAAAGGGGVRAEGKLADRWVEAYGELELARCHLAIGDLPSAGVALDAARRVPSRFCSQHVWLRPLVREARRQLREESRRGGPVLTRMPMTEMAEMGALGEEEGEDEEGRGGGGRGGGAPELSFGAAFDVNAI